jgi:hypothetical protein
MKRRLVSILWAFGMRRFLVGVFGLLVVLQIAATPADASLATALAIAGVGGVALPFLLKLVPAAGKYMVAICVVASLVIALVAEVASGEIVLSNLSATNVPALIAIFLSVEGLSQRLYSILIQSPATAKAVV